MTGSQTRRRAKSTTTKQQADTEQQQQNGGRHPANRVRPGHRHPVRTHREARGHRDLFSVGFHLGDSEALHRGSQSDDNLRPGLQARFFVSIFNNMIENFGVVIQERRKFLGISTRRLADFAGVSYPTISRIENGHEAPRWSTMQRLTHALGLDPSFTATQVTATYTLATVAKDWMKSPSRTGEPDWTSLRSFTDQLSLHPELSNLAIRQRPPRTGSPLVDNLLAAIAEKIAHDCGFRRPAWTRNVEPLASPWESQGTPRKRSTARTRTPIEFSRRGLFLDPVAIWRKNALTRA